MSRLVQPQRALEIPVRGHDLRAPLLRENSLQGLLSLDLVSWLTSPGQLRTVATSS